MGLGGTGNTGGIKGHWEAVLGALRRGEAGVETSILGGNSGQPEALVCTGR